MKVSYVKPQTCDLEADYFVALAASPSESEGNLEGFDNNLTDIIW